MEHDVYAARLLVGTADRGRPRDVHHGLAGEVVHTAPCSAEGAEGYRIFQATMGDVLDGYIDKICLVWVEHRGHRVIWVPVRADSLKKQLLVCAHLEGAGHRGVDATMARLERHCVLERGKTVAFHGRRLCSGGSSVQAGQAPQFHEHLDRTVACCQRR